MKNYVWDDLYKDCEAAKSIIDWTRYKYIYGVPRGGIAFATRMSSVTEIPLTENPIKNETIVLDDIIDSGKTREKYKDFDFLSLHLNKNNKKTNAFYINKSDEWVCYPWELDQEKSGEDIVVRMLEFIGENPNRPGLIDTPKRVTKMWKEIYCGYSNNNFPNITLFPNGEDGVFYNDMIVDQGYFYSCCEHHMVPFFGEYSFGYIPDKYIVGASKIPRVIDFYSSRLQIAERLVYDVINYFEQSLKPLGLILIMKGRHLCKEMRGVKKHNSPFEVIAVRGFFKENIYGCKDEFLSRIKK